MNRLLLLFLIASVAFSCNKKGNPLNHGQTDKYFKEEMAPFYHGVASGDPLTDRVIIWTRVTPKYHGEQPIEWEVSKSDDFTYEVKKGEAVTDSSKDYTVKVDVEGLSPNTKYYYRFKHGETYSQIGITKTAPGGDHPVQLAVVSCTNFEAGYFHALSAIADREDIDAVVHLGDYIYEYGPGTYGDTTLTDRTHLPEHEIVSLQDYRTRFAQYRLDPDFQKAHGAKPFIAVWDDHEIANNSYVDGAQNHQEEEGDYATRSQSAKKAYYEWMPVRGVMTDPLYRKFYFSSQAELIMLDERLEGREQQATDIDDPRWTSDDQTMISHQQEQWLMDALATSQAKWKVIGNQVIFAERYDGHITEKRPYNMDAWDGYPNQRKRILDFIDHGNIKGTVVVTGDTHSSWAFEIPANMQEYKAGNQDIVAVEFGTTSVSSGNMNEYHPMDSVQRKEAQLTDTLYNPHLKYVNLSDHGYLELRLDSQKAVAIWHYVNSVRDRNSGVYKAKR